MADVVVDPGLPYAKMGRKTLRLLLSKPAVVQELTVTQHEGMKFRAKTARWAGEERLVYVAIKDGYTSMDSLPVATGLTSSKVTKAVSKLVKRGAISNMTVTPTVLEEKDK